VYVLTLFGLDIRLVMMIERFVLSFWLGQQKEGHWEKWSQKVKGDLVKE
jgi:hypothetical protein